ncbi:MAG: PAS domain S-box protein, partial [Gemmatimonadetes bacterium]|nr:PAS domain S-box protein [Gemmatimonadota bacterium]
MADRDELTGASRSPAALGPGQPARWRPVLLGALAVGLVGLAVVLPGTGRSSPAWHLASEVVTVTLSCIVGALAFVRFYTHRDRLFLFIGWGFLAAGALDAIHAVLAAGLPAGGGPAPDTDLAAWSWIQARVFLSLFLTVSAFDRFGDRDGGEAEEARIYIQAAVLAAAVLGLFLFLPVPQTVWPELWIPRPWELLPGGLFAIALVGYLRCGRWRTEPFEFWLVLSLLLATLGHVAFMSRSVVILDPYHDVGHQLKLLSIGAVIYGLLLSLHETFRHEAAALRIEAHAHRALAREVEVRRAAESVLQRSEERLQNFLESAHDLIQSTDPDGLIRYVNPAWERTLGYSRHDIEGTPLLGLLHPRCQKRVSDQFAAVLAGEEGGEILAEFIARDGTTVMCAGRATRHVEDGAAVATQSILRDVTAQRAAERELAASRANVKALVENTGDMIWSVDTEHRLVTFNSAFSLATEARWGREPHVGDTPDQVFGEEDLEWYADLYRRVLRGQRFSVLRNKSFVGQVRAFEIFCNPVHEGAGATGAVMFGRDVTRRLKAEEALRIAKEEAEMANQAKSQFLANMSHELRTPLNSVIGFANILLKNKRGNFGEKDLGFLDRILSNGRHLLALINEVLDLAKVEAGRMELDIEPVDLAELIEETVAQLEGQAREKSVELTARCDARPPAVQTDLAKLKQVMINLIGNALKFSEGGSVTVHLLADDDGVPTGIAVEDTGVGIPEDRLEAIFEAFAQADQTTSRRFGGTGLGLAISRSMCRLLGYDLEVTSTVGEGSTFTIRILEPRRADPRAPIPSSVAAALSASDGETPSSAEDALQVLVVDDEDDARLMLSHHLRDFGCAVLTATSGAEAVEV